MKQCCGQAVIVCVDHVNSSWGLELLISLLKHTCILYCVEIPCVTNGHLH